MASGLIRVPNTKRAATELLRLRNIRGLKVESIDPELDRIYCLTRYEVLQPDGMMRKLARTVVFQRLRDKDGNLVTELILLKGWIVGDDDVWEPPE